MSELDLDLLAAQCVRFLRAHVDRLNAGDIEGAVEDHFFPASMNDLPRRLAVQRMIALRPIEVTELVVRSAEPVRRKGGIEHSHGDFASVAVSLTVQTGRGERKTAHLPVWWSPVTEHFLVAMSEIVELTHADRELVPSPLSQR